MIKTEYQLCLLVFFYYFCTMAAPKGNRFWELRSEKGAKALFESPKEMYKAACEYFEWCEDNPLIETDYRGKDADVVKIPRVRAFTMEGLCMYLGCSTSYFRVFKHDVSTGKKDEKYKAFLTVIGAIEDIIRRQKFENAAAGFLQWNIIARDLGLKDETKVEHSGEIKDVQVFEIGGKQIKLG